MHSILNQETVRTLDDMYRLAESEGVSVINFALPKCRAMSFLDGKSCYIGLDNSKKYSASEEKSMLAHELGHCQTGAFYNEYTPFSVRSKCERQADEWAILTCVPYDSLIDAYESGIYHPYELAEYFGVSEAFLKKALDYYIDKEQNDASFRENNKKRNYF